MSLRKLGRQELIPISFLLLLLFTGIFTYKDYGETFDENIWIGYGQMMLHFLKTGERVFERSIALAAYGPVGDTITAVISLPFNPGTYSEGLAARHFANFIMSMAGLLALYHFVRIVYGWKAGLIGMALCVLLPRLYGNSFNNPKDLIFAVFYMLSLLGLMLYLKKKSIPRLILCGMLMGLSIDQRIGGVFLIPVTIFMLFYAQWREGIFAQKGLSTSIGRLLVHFTVFFLTLVFAIYIFHPYLWHDPLNRFILIWRMMSKVEIGELGISLFMGRFIDIGNLPWYYIPVWMHITFPVPTLILIYAGLAFGIFRLVKRVSDREEEYLLLISTLSVFIPLSAIILKRATLYDEVRHLTFIFYPLLIIAVSGVINIGRALGSGRLKKAAFSTLAVYYLWVLINMIVLHPYQAIYFNEFVGGLKGAAPFFETDYWGRSYKEGIEWLNSHTKGDVRVATGKHFNSDHYFREGIIIDQRDPDFYMSTTRYNDHRKVDTQPVHVVTREGVPLLYIKPVSREALAKLDGTK